MIYTFYSTQSTYFHFLQCAQFESYPQALSIAHFSLCEQAHLSTLRTEHATLTCASFASQRASPFEGASLHLQFVVYVANFQKEWCSRGFKWRNDVSYGKVDSSLLGRQAIWVHDAQVTNLGVHEPNDQAWIFSSWVGNQLVAPIFYFCCV